MKGVYFVLLPALVLVFGCASGPRLEEFPRREIDRPYTLPKGVATWHIPTIYQSAKDGVSSNTFGPFYAGLGSRTDVEAHQAVVNVVHFW